MTDAPTAETESPPARAPETYHLTLDVLDVISLILAVTHVNVLELDEDEHAAVERLSARVREQLLAQAFEKILDDDEAWHAALRDLRSHEGR